MVGYDPKVDLDEALARIISDPAATDYVAVEAIWQEDALRAAQTPAAEPVTE